MRKLTTVSAHLSRCAQLRMVTVAPGGPISSTKMQEPVAPLAEAPWVADFGSVKRRDQRRKERELRNKEAMDSLSYLQRIITRPTEQQELEAKSLLKDMGFNEKPPSCLYHRQFLSELRRYKMDLGLAPSGPDVQLFSLTDYGVDGKGEEIKLCNELRCATEGGEINMLSELHEAANHLLLNTSPSEFKIKMLNEFKVGFSLELKSVFPLMASNSPSPLDSMNVEDKAAAEHQKLLMESLKMPFVTVPGGPYRRYTQRIDATIVNCQNGSKRELFSNLSAQAFTYLFIMGVSKFIRSAKSQKIAPYDSENIGFLRYSIVNLRQQIGMEPIGEFELDKLLPKLD